MLREKLLMSLPSHYLVRTDLLLFPGIIVSVTVQLLVDPFLNSEFLRLGVDGLFTGCFIGLTMWINHKYELALKDVEKDNNSRSQDRNGKGKVKQASNRNLLPPTKLR